MTEREAMRRALDLAVRGWGRVAPNPLVGAVLLREGEVVGEGFHAEFGGPHAEVMALRACAEPRGTTCLVTLEPCTHVGKTPPCVDALVAAGVARVVVASPDPTPQAAGGATRLRQAGVEVETGLSCREASALNASFFANVARPDRPFLALKVATSLDGFLADERGSSRWISGEAARDYVHWLRAGFDAIGVGRRTAVADDPALTVRGALTPRVPPTRVIFTRTGAVPGHLQLVRSARDTPTVVLAPPARVAAVKQAVGESGVTVLDAPGLRSGLEALRAREVRSILIEGGGEMASTLLEQELVDRVYWIQAPIWLGHGTPAFGPRPGRRLDEARPWEVVERRELGADTLLVVDRELCLQAS